jgi:hypothetical protein
MFQLGLGFGASGGGIIVPEYPDEVTVSTPRGIVKDALKQLVAESETFQTALGLSGGETEIRIAYAKTRIHKTEYAVAAEETGAFLRPFALILNTQNNDDSAVAVSGSGVRDFIKGGDLELRLEREIPETYRETGQEANAEADFENFYEGVINDISALAGRPGYLVINSISVIEGPVKYDPTSSEKYVYVIRLLVGWGMK